MGNHRRRSALVPQSGYGVTIPQLSHSDTATERDKLRMVAGRVGKKIAESDQAVETSSGEEPSRNITRLLKEMTVNPMVVAKMVPSTTRKGNTRVTPTAHGMCQ